MVGIKDAGNQEKVEQIKNEMNRNNFYFYVGGEVGVEEKVLHGYDRLSSIAGNVFPAEIRQWFEKMVRKEKISKQESEKIEGMMEQVYQGNAIVNLKKSSIIVGFRWGFAEAPLEKFE